MQLAITPEQFNQYYVLYGKRTKNTIVQDSNFININYSTELMTLNNISIHFTLNDVEVTDYYNKYRCDYAKSDFNHSVISKLIHIEKKVLEKYIAHTSAFPCYRLKEQLMTNRLKIFALHELKTSTYKKCELLLKISGIWETNNEYGIIYKFYVCN